MKRETVHEINPHGAFRVNRWSLIDIFWSVVNGRKEYSRGNQVILLGNEMKMGNFPNYWAGK